MVKKNQQVEDDSVDAVLDKLATKYRNEIFRYDNKTSRIHIPTGSLRLDRILGGGIPTGCITQMFGPELTGKTTLTYHLVHEAQKLGLEYALIESENKLSYEYAGKIGVNVEHFLKRALFIPIVEDAFSYVYDVLDQTSARLIIIDSIAGLSPKWLRENEKTEGDKLPQIGSFSKGIKHGLNRIKPMLREKQVALFLTNQLSVDMRGQVVTLQPPGGYALQHASALKLNTKRKEVIKDVYNNVLGVAVGISIPKPSVDGLLPSNCEITFRYGMGIDKMEELLAIAKEMKITRTSGKWYYYNDIVADGLDNFKEMLVSSGEYETLKQTVLANFLCIPTGNTVADVTTDNVLDRSGDAVDY